MPSPAHTPAGRGVDQPTRPTKRRTTARALAPAVTPDLLDHLGIATRYPWSPRWQSALETCPRSFYWEAVAARNATRVDTPSGEGRRAWALQHLLTVPHLIARLVRSAVRQVVGAVALGERPPAASRVIDAACFTYDQTWIGSASADSQGRFWRGPATYPALQEFVVGPGLPESARDEGRSRIVTAIHGISMSPILEAVRVARRYPVHIGSLFPEPVPIGRAVLGWVSPSLIYDARPTRRPSGSPQWVVAQLEVDSPSTPVDPAHGRRREIDSATTEHWLTALQASEAAQGSSGGGPGAAVVEIRTIHLDEEGRIGAPQAPTEAVQLTRVTDGYAAAMAAAGAAPRSLEGAAIGAFPMAPAPARCRVCRFAPLCETPVDRGSDDQKLVQPAIPSPIRRRIIGHVPTTSPSRT